MLAFDREGQGAPAFVFVHGFGCAREDWSAQVAAFSGSHNCISLDLPGFGDSPALGELPCPPPSIPSQYTLSVHPLLSVFRPRILPACLSCDSVPSSRVMMIMDGEGKVA